MGDSREGGEGLDAPVTRNSSTGEKSKDDGVHLKKSMNLFHCVALMVSVTGHSAIFIAPTSILKASGSVGMSLLAWVFGGIINLGLAMCFTELGTMMPKAGGPYIFILQTFGQLPGFLLLWGYMLLLAAPFWSFQAKTAALYIIKAIFPECDLVELEWGIRLLAAWIIVTLVVLNCVYMKYVNKVQVFLSASKVIALLLIIAGGVAMLVKGNTENFENAFDGSNFDAGNMSLAVFYSIFSYGAWQILLALAEEVKNPGRVLPISVYVSFFIVITKFTLVNVAYYTLIPAHELMKTNAVALVFMKRLWAPLVPVMSLLVGAVTVGALNAAIMGHSRIMFAGSRVGHAAAIFGMIHYKYMTPGPAIIILAVWSLIILFVGGFVIMMRYITMFSITMSLLVVSALLYLRWTKPELPRPYKTYLFVPVVQLILLIFVLAFSIYQDPLEMGMGYVVLLLGVPVYFIVVSSKKPRVVRQYIEMFTVTIQKVLGVVKPSKVL